MDYCAIACHRLGRPDNEIIIRYACGYWPQPEEGEEQITAAEDSSRDRAIAEIKEEVENQRGCSINYIEN